MWSYAAAIAVFATAAGCNGGSRPEAGTNEPTTTLTTAASPLDVTVTAEPSSVPAGGRLRIRPCRDARRCAQRLMTGNS